MDPDKLWYLRHLDIFAGMTDAEMRRLAERTVMREYSRGKIIARPDDPPDTIYLIKKGRVKLSRYSASGREQVLALLERGEIFGEHALVGAHSSMHCEAFEDTLICVLSLQDFEDLLRAKPDLALRVIKLLAARLRRAEEEIENLAFRDVPGRLSALLVRLAEAGEPAVESQHEGRRLMLRLTHQDLASMIGATRETVTHVLNKFREMGLISIQRRQIMIKGLRRLRRVVGKTDGAH